MGRQPALDEKEPVTRRIRKSLMQRVRAFAEGCSPRATDTAVIEAALEEYLDRHEPKTKREK